jgi:hypothetical protein
MYYSYIQVHFLFVFTKFLPVYKTFSLFCKKGNLVGDFLRFLAFFSPINIVLDLIHLIRTTFRKLVHLVQQRVRDDFTYSGDAAVVRT